MRVTMKAFTKKTISLLLVVALILNLAGVTFYADKTADFSVYLSSDQSVVANYNKISKIISITGNGTIEFDKWVALAKKIDGVNYPVKNSASATGGWQSSTANMVISFDNGKVSLCDSKNHSGLFENFKGQILFNHHVDRALVSNLSNLFKGASAIKQLDITTSTSAAIVATANDLLTGTNPDSVKFDKLAAFSWQLPADYKIIEGATGKQKTKTLTAGTTAFFNANTPYQLNKIVQIKQALYKSQTMGQKNAASFNMQLASGALADDVIASYNAATKKISISGNGKILQDKWIALARKIASDASYTAVSGQKRGWRTEPEISMTFDKNASIQFDEKGFNKYASKNYGWFQDFKGTIAFNDAVDTSNLTNMSNMFERTKLFNDPSISRWKTSKVTSMSRMFRDAESFNQPLETNAALNYWNVSKVTHMIAMFKGTKAFNGSLAGWDTASCTDMQSLFEDSIFNQSVNHFDVRKVKDMSYMFSDNLAFNQSIDNWRTDKLVSMSYIFEGATAVKNIDLSKRSSASLVAYSVSMLNETEPDELKFHRLKSFKWKLPAKYKITKVEVGSQVTEIVDVGTKYTFDANTRYEMIKVPADYQPVFPMQLASGTVGDSVLANYDLTTKQITISGKGTILEEKWKLLAREIKGDATPFTEVNGQKRGWQTAQDIHMLFDTNAKVKFETNGFQHNSGYGWFQDFAGTIQINNTINTSNMTNMAHMFERAGQFNDPSVMQWDTSNVTNMNMLFNEAGAFNQNLNKWDVSKVASMISMFRLASNFNGSLAGWNTSNCRNMNSMFAYSKFNQPINHFDVRQVENMRFMFYKDYAFNQPLDSWQTDSLTAVYSMFSNATSFNQDISNINTAKVLNSEDGLSAMFTNASVIKQIDLSNRADNSEIVVATGLLDGTNPDTVKFDRLAEFNWQLPDDYQIKKGDIGSQTTEFVTAGTNYTFVADTRYEVQKLPVEPDVSLNAFEKAYDGNAITTQYLIDNSVVNPENIAGSWQFDNSNLVNAGSYTLNVTFKPDNSNYYSEKTLAVNVKINKRPLTLPALTIIKEWDGTTAATIFYDEAVIKAGVISGDSVTISPITGVYATSEVGSGKTVVLSGGALDNANYSLAIPNSTTGEIVKATPTCAIQAQLNAVYGDTLSDVNVVGSGQGTWQFQQPPNSSVGAVGDHQQTMIFYPADTAHYNTKTANTTLSVARKALSLTNPTVNDKVYDGTTTAVLTYEGLDGVVADDASAVSVDTISATFDSSEAGMDKSVTVNSVTLKGAKSNNYSIVLPTALTGEISKALPTFTVPTDLRLSYGGALKDIQLPVEVGGKWQFKTPEIRPSVIGASKYKLLYLPNNSNYENALLEVMVLIVGGAGDNDDDDADQDDEIANGNTDLEEINTVDTNITDSTDETTAADNSSDSAQSVQPAQNLKLVETISFDISANTTDTSETAEQAPPSQEVALNNGTASLTIEKSEAGATAQLELKPKPGYRVAKVELRDETGKEVNYIIDDNGLFTILIPKGKLSVDVKFDFVLPAAPTFDDVPLNHPNALAIEHLFAEKIMIGLADKLFDEAAALNRAMIIKILHNMAGNPQADTAVKFEDISVGAWYYQALQWSFKNGIAKGCSNKLFAPLKVVTKEEFLTFLYRYHIKGVAVKDEYFDLSMYKDSIDISNYAKAAFKWALEHQLIEASETGELAPKAVVERAAAAEIIHRYLSIR